jgi:alkylation response protein AidB-like acyl-CoA dehydrogenase
LPAYTAPLRDIRFVLHDLLGLERTLAATGAFPGLDRALIDQVLEEAATLSAERIQPHNQSADAEGCRLTPDGVVVPPGIKAAWQAFRDGGWPSLTARPEHGGQGLPKTLAFVLNEMTSSASIAASDYFGLFTMVYRMVQLHASPELQARYSEGLAQGRFGGTMCMTEPHCGTDVGLAKTRAEPNEDGSWRITGTKIFISAGDHDLTENIVHLVLARAVGDQPGSRGLSLFLTPKLLPDGSRNSLKAVRLEHKLAYAGSATCQMAFDGAQAWLIGERSRGLMAMFDMVNAARLMVGSQGMAGAEQAYQIAAAYSRQRLQGRAPGKPAHPELPADPILCHPDVRRLLLSARAFIEAARALYLGLGLEVDLLEVHPDPERRKAAADWLGFLTSTTKATLADYGVWATNDCLQVLGGHGYIRDNGIEQILREVRLNPIQEGANGMLALDLIRRQIPRDAGAVWRRFLATLQAEEAAAPQALADLAQGLAEGRRRLERATAWIQEHMALDPAEAGAAGTDYQRIFGLVLLAWQWLRLARAAQARLDAGEPDADGFLAGKLMTARFFYQRMLPFSEGHWLALRAGAASTMAPPPDYFWPAG